MKSLRKLLITCLIGAPSLVCAGDELADREAEAEKRADGRELVDCSDYRGVMRRVGDKCLRPIGVTRVYSRDELLLTGQFGLGQSLKRLDPSIQ